MNLGMPSSSLPTEELKRLLHSKIDQMDERQLNLLNRVMLQLEAEVLAERLGSEFDEDDVRGRFQRIPDLVRQFRSEHRYV